MFDKQRAARSLQASPTPSVASAPGTPLLSAPSTPLPQTLNHNSYCPPLQLPLTQTDIAQFPPTGEFEPLSKAILKDIHKAETTQRRRIMDIFGTSNEF